MDFTLDQLRAIDAIERNGTFAAAAKEMHRVPSAVTYLVQSLESALDVQLFERSGRRAVLTKAGARVLELARDVLSSARSLEQVATELSGGWEPELHVIVDAALPMTPLTACLARFADPEVPTRLRVDVECQEGVIDQFEATNADVALYLGFDSDAQATAYDRVRLPDLDVLLVAAPEHPLAGAPITDPARARFAELVVRDSSQRFAERAKPSFTGSRNVVYLGDFHSKRAALLAGAGYGWAPRHLIDGDLAAGTLVMIDASMNTWTYRPEIVTRRDAGQNRARELFVETLLGAG